MLTTCLTFIIFLILITLTDSFVCLFFCTKFPIYHLNHFMHIHTRTVDLLWGGTGWIIVSNNIRILIVLAPFSFSFISSCLPLEYVRMYQLASILTFLLSLWKFCQKNKWACRPPPLRFSLNSRDVKRTWEKEERNISFKTSQKLLVRYFHPKIDSLELELHSWRLITLLK